MNEVLDAIGDVIAWLIPVPLIGFMVVYARHSPWRADPIGIERMVEKWYLLALAVLILAGNFLPDEFDTIRLIARIAIFALVLVGLTVQVVNLRRVQTHSPRALFFQRFTKRYPRKKR